MASANFLTVKTHLSEFKNNSDKDTASESGTSNSVTSGEDLQKLALILGLNSAEDVYQERFRVDRRRLETMFADNLEESQTAQAFFHRVMNETNTLINWPARLKIGARSKKDPHVRVAGRPDDVKLAKEKIMQLLDIRSNRVTMKIDVSYTDHSHIIGKGGLTIKRVMEETGCHIHFPDSNRTSAVEKSNQVSIAGDLDRVERARARVRALTPLVFTFELPIVSTSQPLPDLNSPYVQQIQDQYHVQVMLRNRAKLHANLVVVKGVQWEVRAAMEATTLLIAHMCGPLKSQTQVHMTLEISPMHHHIVTGGRNAEQLKMIIKGTGAQIMFPDAEDPNVPLLKKSCVTISGRIQDVYAARQQLVGSLPVVVIFDVSEDSCRIDPELANKLMHKHNVYINVRRKPKQGIASVVIKGIERCVGDIYEARRELLGGVEGSVAAEIPESFHIPLLPAPLLHSLFTPAVAPSPPHPHPLTLNAINSPCSPYEINYNMQSPYNPPTPGGYPSPLSPAALNPPVFNPWLIPSPQPRTGPFHYPTMPSVGQPGSVMYTNQGGTWNPMSTGGEMQPPMMMQPPYQQMATDGRTTLHQLLNSSSQASSGYQSNFTGSCVSLDTHSISGGEGSAGGVASPSVSPISQGRGSQGASPAPSPADHDRDRGVNELATIMSELPLSARRAPGCEKKTLETRKMSPLADYRHMKAEADKAMKESVGSGYRVPTPRWAGLYFSRTSPGPVALNDEPHTPEKPWPRAEVSRPNIVEIPPTPPSAKPCRYQQLQVLLRDVGLHKYIDLFKKHELDMSTFASLSEADLMEIGVTAFGARRKMLLIIQELQKQSCVYKVSPASGEKKLIASPPQYDTAPLTHDKW